jgi:AcrR family transcriptional regulator
MSEDPPGTDVTSRRSRERRASGGPYDRTVPRKQIPTGKEDGRSAKSAATRERILNATAHVLSRKGYSATRLGDIADQAQLQAPAIYYYFGSREELIEEVMAVGIQRLRQHVEEVLEGLPAEMPPMDRIIAAVEAHLQIVLSLSEFATAVIRNSGQMPEEAHARQLAEEAMYGTIWQKLIRDAHAEGQIRADLDLRIAHRLIIGALNWSAEWWNPSRDSLAVIVRTAQSLVRHGLSGVLPTAQDG